MQNYCYLYPQLLPDQLRCLFIILIIDQHCRGTVFMSDQAFRLAPIYHHYKIVMFIFLIVQKFALILKFFLYIFIECFTVVITITSTAEQNPDPCLILHFNTPLIYDIILNNISMFYYIINHTVTAYIQKNQCKNKE